MNSSFRLAALALLLTGLCGCENPADHAPKAQVAEAAAILEEPAEATAVPAPTGEVLPISPETTKLEFVGSKVTGSHPGGFKKLTGTFVVVPEKPEASRLEAEIDMDSTWSDSDRLTKHLESADFFDVAKHPTAKFVSTAIVPADNGESTHQMTGNLTLHGVTKSISFPARLTVTDETVALHSEFSINRKDFGIEYPGSPDDLIRDEVVIKLSVDAPRQGAPAADAVDAPPEAE